MGGQGLVSGGMDRGFVRRERALELAVEVVTKDPPDIRDAGDILPLAEKFLLFLEGKAAGS